MRGIAEPRVLAVLVFAARQQAQMRERLVPGYAGVDIFHGKGDVSPSRLSGSDRVFVLSHAGGRFLGQIVGETLSRGQVPQLVHRRTNCFRTAPAGPITSWTEAWKNGFCDKAAAERPSGGPCAHPALSARNCRPPCECFRERNRRTPAPHPIAAHRHLPIETGMCRTACLPAAW